MGKDASELREEIGATRDRMGDTADAIAYKADIPGRVKSSITGTVSGLRKRASDVIPDLRGVRENPLGLFFGAAALGFLFGTLLPGTQLEAQRLGPIGDQLKEQAKERVQETIGAVRDAVTS